MRIPALLATLALTFLASCSSPPQAKPESFPALVTTTPVLRTDKALFNRHMEIVDNARKGGHRILFLGASIIEGWEHAGKETWNAVWLPQHAIDCGVGGDRTQNVLARLDNSLLDALAIPTNNFRWIILHIGSNNTDTDSPDEIAVGVEAIIAKLQERFPKAQIIYTILPRGEFPNPLRDKMTIVKQLLADEIAADRLTNTQIMDLGPSFLTPDGRIPAELMPDFQHPSAAGYKIWSDELVKAIRGS